MARLRTLLLLLGLCVATMAVAAPSVQGQTATAQQSANVTRVGTLDEPGVVSVRAQGGHLFVSTVSGLSVYDVKDAQKPVRVGRLELPVAQNEDVDVAGDILLMSDEPGVGTGVLHVIDIADPANPKVLSTYSTWAAGLFAGLTGRDDRRPARGGIGHTATCIDGCRWAYLAGSDAGIEIVDLRDPRNPRFGGRFATPETAYGIGTHDVQVDRGGLAWIAGGGGTAAYDVRDPAKPKLVFRTDRSGRGPSLKQAADGTFGSGNGRNDLLHHNSLRLTNGSVGAPGDAGALSDVVAITEEDLYRPTCRGAGTFETWRIGRGGILRHLDSWRVERDPGAFVACSAHYFDERAGVVAQGWFEQGVRFLDVRNPEDVKQVGFWVPPGGMFWGAVYPPTDESGQTVYAVDHARGIDVLTLDRARLDQVTRRAPSRRGSRNTSIFIDDRRDEVRPGGKVRVLVDAFSIGRPPARGARVVLRLPEQADSVRANRGAQVFPASRRVIFPVSSRSDLTRGVAEVRVARDARPGALIFEARLERAAGESMLLDDRFVDRDRITTRPRRTSARAAGVGAGSLFLCQIGAPRPGAGAGAWPAVPQLGASGLR